MRVCGRVVKERAPGSPLTHTLWNAFVNVQLRTPRHPTYNNQPGEICHSSAKAPVKSVGQTTLVAGKACTQFNALLYLHPDFVDVQLLHQGPLLLQVRLRVPHRVLQIPDCNRERISFVHSRCTHRLESTSKGSYLALG